MSERGLPKTLERIDQWGLVRVADFLRSETNAPVDFSSTLRAFAETLEHDEIVRLAPPVQEAIREFADGNHEGMSSRELSGLLTRD